jgi:hypothetical protein
MKLNKSNIGTRNRKLASVLAAALLIGTAPAAAWLPGSAQTASAAPASVALKVASQPFVIDGVRSTVPTANVNGDTYIGIRSLNEKLGLATNWDSKSRTVTINGRNRTFKASPDKGSYLLNGQPVYGSPAILNNGSAYMPLRFLLERMGYSISYDGPSRTVGIRTIKENVLVISSKKIVGNVKNQPLHIYYPFIAGYANDAAQTKINAFLKKEAEAYAVSGQKAISQGAADNEAYRMDNPDAKVRVMPVSYDGSYTVTYNEQNRLSLYMDYYIDLGGAHGMTVRIPYTFDLTTGNVLTLKEVTGGKADYVSIINASIRNQIKATKLALIAPFDGIKSDRPYYLKQGAVVIAFEQYEYTPYAAGMPEFAIPFTAF